MTTISEWAEYYKKMRVWVFPYMSQEMQWKFWKNKHDMDYWNLSKTWAWNDDTGLKLVVGKKGIRVIELHNRDLLDKALSLLGLPEDYPWIIVSCLGYGIVVDTPNVSSCVFGMTNRGYKDVLLLWEGYYVLPTTGIPRYFYKNRMPSEHPTQVTDEVFVDCVDILRKS